MKGHTETAEGDVGTATLSAAGVGRRFVPIRHSLCRAQR